MIRKNRAVYDIISDFKIIFSLFIILLLFFLLFKVMDYFNENKYKKNLYNYIEKNLPDLKIQNPSFKFYYKISDESLIPSAIMTFFFKEKEFTLSMYDKYSKKTPKYIFQFSSNKDYKFDLDGFKTILSEKIEDKKIIENMALNYLKKEYPDYTVDKNSINFSHREYNRNNRGCYLINCSVTISKKIDDSFFIKEDIKNFVFSVENKTKEILFIGHSDPVYSEYNRVDYIIPYYPINGTVSVPSLYDD